MISITKIYVTNAGYAVTLFAFKKHILVEEYGVIIRKKELWTRN